VSIFNFFFWSSSIVVGYRRSSVLGEVGTTTIINFIMSPKLRVTAGPSTSSSELVAVNHDSDPLEIENEHFKGRLSVRIKDFVGDGEQDDQTVLRNAASGYFDEHTSVTWSIQIQGLRSCSHFMHL
jgi:hypothetical protein